MEMGSSGKYWWLEPADVLSKQLDSHHDTWLQYGSNPITQAWLRNAIAYYSTMLEPNDWQSALGYVGEQGELVKMLVPQARAFLRQMISLVTKQRLDFKCLAETQDNDVANDAKLGDALAEDIVHEHSLERKAELALECAGVWGMGYLKCTWRTDRGTPYMAGVDSMSEDSDGNPVPGRLIEYDGDLEITVPTVYEVFFDSRITDWDQIIWAECRTMKSRWDLIAQYPELEVYIKQLPGVREGAALGGHQGIGLENEDLVYVYEAYHKFSPALPKGRMLVYGSSECIFYDGINPYEGIPIVPLKPEPILGFGHGYPKLCDLLPCQEMFDMCLSAIATNNSTLGVQSVLAPRNSDISVNEIGGINFIYYSPQTATGGGEPKAMQLTQSAPETFKFAQMLKENMGELSNINSTMRGAPPSGATSGTAIATLSANGLEFMSSLSKAYQIALEDVMEIAIKNYAKFATVPRMLSIVGKNQKAHVKEFVGKDLQAIKKVRLTTTNPLLGTLGGRIDTADKLLNAGMLKDPDAYFAILDGQPVQEAYQTELSEENLVQSENELLTEGEPVQALATDDHGAHVRSHGGLLNDPAIRMNSSITKAVLDHIQEHIGLAKSTDPFLTALVRTGKIPQPPPQPPGPPQGGPPPGPPMQPGMMQHQAGPPPPPQQVGPPQGMMHPQPPMQHMHKVVHKHKVPPAPIDNPSAPTGRPANEAKDLLGRPI